jgi:hypothetical protein
VVVSAITRWWPTNKKPACMTPGVEVDARFTTEELGDLRGSFTWTGESVEYEVDTGVSLATPTTTPMPSAPTPEPTLQATPPAVPSQLPRSGGSPISTSDPTALPAS